MSSEPAARPPSRIVAGLAFCVLWLLVGLRLPWEEPASTLGWLRPSPDLALLLSLGLLFVARFGVRALATHAIACALVLSAAYHVAATAMPAFYYRPFVAYYDVLFLPGLIHLLLHEHDPWAQKGLIVTAALVFLAFYGLLVVAIRAVLCLGTERALARGFAGTCLVLGAVGLFVPVWSPGRLLGLAQDVGRIPRDMRLHRLYVEGLGEYERRASELHADLSKLQGVDVYVLFIESYGRVLLDKPSLAAQFGGWAAEWEAELADAGFACKSTFAHAPGKGGGSSWGHMQLLSGVPVGNVRNFELVLQSDLRPLPGLLSAVGHRALMVQPMMEQPWPEGQAFYGFDDDIHRQALAYAGFPYHWGRVPDQFALARVLTEVVEPSEQPVFLLYVSISSHAPFKNLPPYLEDWSAVLAPDAFAGQPGAAFDINFLNYKRHPDAERAYLEAMRYSMQTMTGFARQLERPSLVFILGDHQPPSLKSFEGFDDSYDVPMHILANRADLLAPFAAMTKGLVPDPDEPALRTQQFLELFVQAFSAER